MLETVGEIRHIGLRHTAVYGHDVYRFLNKFVSVANFPHFYSIFIVQFLVYEVGDGAEVFIPEVVCGTFAGGDIPLVLVG